MMKGVLLATLLALPGCLPPMRSSAGARLPADTLRVAGAPAPLVPLSWFVDSLVTDERFRNAYWGVLVLDPASGDTLYARNAERLFMPASNMKIITGTVALALLGPDYRFRTVIAARGPVIDGTLRGDLLVIGRGDPSVSDNTLGDAMTPLRAVADSLSSRGVVRVAGRLLRAGDAFPGAIYGYGWGWDDFDYAYSAGVDELLFNEGFTRVVVVGGSAPGEPVTAGTVPARTSPPVRVTAATVAPGDSAGVPRRSRVRVRQDSGSTGILVEGEVLPGDTVFARITHRDPGEAYLDALREALAERGIVVEGAQRDTTAVVDTLLVLHSPPLREILPRFEKPSQNQIGEMLLRTLGLERLGVGTPDSGRVVVERQLEAWGVQPDGYVIRDGSGLSRHNYLSPAAIVRVLEVARQDTAFRVFYDALPIAGVDGTIATRMRGTPAEGNVRAKTGTIDRASALSGYVTTADGRQLIFSILGNNFTTPTRAVRDVQDAIAIRLASGTARPEHAAGH